MARKNGPGFKMKSSPVKGLSNFFSSLGRKGTEERQEKQVRENQGMTNFEKRRAEKKSRKAGESKYQADVRRRGQKKAATQEGNRMNAEDKASRDANTARINAEIKALEEKKKTNKVEEQTVKKTSEKVVKTKKKKQKIEVGDVDITPTLGPLDPKYLKEKTGDKELTLEDFKRITSPKSKPGEFIGWDKVKEKFTDFIDPRGYLKENIKKSGIGSMFFKKSPYQLGIGKDYTKQPKGSRGYKMKKK